MWTSALGNEDGRYRAIAGNEAAKHDNKGAYVAASALGDAKWGVGVNNTGNDKDPTCGNNDSAMLAMKSAQFGQGRQRNASRDTNTASAEGPVAVEWHQVGQQQQQQV
jgi:hypothetical protein